jgi:hypothetical protein
MTHASMNSVGGSTTASPQWIAGSYGIGMLAFAGALLGLIAAKF